MLVKVSKYPNSALFSDLEEKGKGQRKKMPSKRFDYPIDASENYALLKKEKGEQYIPYFRRFQKWHQLHRHAF